MTVLSRKLGKSPPDAAPVPLTATRAMRLALARAAQGAAGLQVSVQGVSVDTVPLDELAGELGETGLIFALAGEGGVAGACVLNLPLVRALGELCITGRVTLEDADRTEVTGTDARLAAPMVDALLRELAQAAAGTALDGWIGGIARTDRVREARALALDLPDCAFRVVRASLDFGVDGAEGEVALALPSPQPAAAPAASEPADPVPDWAERMAAAVLPAPAALDAVLHRLDLTLPQLDGMRAGQILPLPGARIDGVRLETVTGQLFAEGRLGQYAGRMAVRLEPASLPQLHDLPERRRAETVSLPPG